ncbi:MAG: transcriptional regulator [Flavobacteriaceae bacterium]|nr:MAG: transcriptional regulator [Flavobacteriaceae bacterium]
MHIDLPNKLYYSIGEIAKAFSVNPSLIRFWEKEFEVIQPKKNARGTRMFKPQDVENFKLIYHLVKERGYTLEGAKEALKVKPELSEESGIIFKLESIKQELLSLKEALD